MTVSTETIPPPRAKRWPIVLGVLVVIGVLSLPNVVRTMEGQSPDQLATIFDSLWARLVPAFALALVFLWLLSWPSRMLVSKLRKSGIDSPIPIYSSSELEDAIKALNGVVVGSHALPATAFLAFVDVGSKFEIWRWHRGQPQCVARLRWEQVASIGLDAVSHFTTIDRAIVLNVPKNGRTVGLPISPQHPHLVQMRPMKDVEFVATLRHFRMSMESNRPRENSDKKTPPAE